jgi:hypothetical protein
MEEEWNGMEWNGRRDDGSIDGSTEPIYIYMDNSSWMYVYHINISLSWNVLDRCSRIQSQFNFCPFSSEHRSLSPK